MECSGLSAAVTASAPDTGLTAANTSPQSRVDCSGLSAAVTASAPDTGLTVAHTQGKHTAADPTTYRHADATTISTTSEISQEGEHTAVDPNPGLPVTVTRQSITVIASPPITERSSHPAAVTTNTQDTGLTTAQLTAQPRA